MGFSSRKYVDMIYKVSGKYGNWNPPRRVEVGDWGEIDKDTGDFIREGNIFDDLECKTALSELSRVELVKNGSPEGEVRIIAGDTVEVKTNLYTDVGGTGELGIRVQGEWEFNPRNRAALLTMIDPYSYYLEVGITFPKLRELRKLKGKAIVTEALHCPAYALLLTEKGKGGKASLSMYTGLSEAGVGVGAGTKAGWRHSSESGMWRTACEYRTGDEKDAVYTPLYKLQKVSMGWLSTGWLPRYRGAPAKGGVPEEPVDEEYTPPWEELDEDGEELDYELASPEF